MKNSIRMMPAWLLMILAARALVACGGGESEPPADSAPAAQEAEAEPAPEPEPTPEPEPEPAPEPEPEPAEAEPEPAAPAAPASAATGEVAQITIGALDLMQFTQREFEVQAGQTVELTLEHRGQLPVQAMGHNVVILPAGEDYMAFSSRVISEGGSIDNEYLPESMRADVIAYTRMIGGGESDTITFTAPDTPGEYPFLCTFPAHANLMNGVMTVR